MAKELNEYQVRLTFDANTEKAKKQLKDLQQQLQSLATGSGTNKLNFSDEIAKASKAAAELSAHLSQATNMKTGTLDFTRLNDSIKKSGQSLANYGEQLLKLGPSGQQAFQKLATAVSNSEIPVRRISNTLREMGTVLKNTIKWQISSSAIHSFMGAVQSAYGYAQDLNESLNNIRIVTGQNIEQMEKFAATANKAARALSASTLDYTDAALIYYQQGLSDEEVKARTDVTVKMANVTSETAEKVSQQLTAVWNNFAKGADNLEYFADVMTALGAATASSTDEISAGLEKFSAVAETVGLSYEYATAALATVTATTRQSADVVGNAFKTIFARLEGLKLGETLEDDTDLNKYSAALHNVGVEIKNTDGSLKDMDTILDELSNRWQTLSRDQQMALAQTVAGVRQYNTLISLMNNWDFMQENLETARNASGTLQKQADIYAESWEAAQKRVKAAVESVYQSLIDDKFFITLLDGTEKVITGVNNLIKAVGGLPGVLSVVATVFTNLFEKQMVQGLQNLTYTLQNLTEKGRKKTAAQKEASLNELLGVSYNADYTTRTEQVNAETLRESVKLKAELVEASKNLNEIEIATSKTLLEQVDNLEQAKRQQAEQLELAEQAKAILTEDISGFVYDRMASGDLSNKDLPLAFAQLDKAKNVISETILKEKELEEISNKLNNTTTRQGSNISDLATKLDQFIQKNSGLFKEYNTNIKTVTSSINSMKGALAQGKNIQVETLLKDVNLLSAALRTARTSAENAMNAITKQDVGKDYTSSIQAIDEAEKAYKKTVDDLKYSVDTYHESLIKGQNQTYTWQQGIVQSAQILSGLSMAFNQIKGIISTLGDENLGFFDKLLSVSMSLGMAIPNVLRGFSNIKEMATGVSNSLEKLALSYALEGTSQDVVTAKTEAYNLVKGLSYTLGEKENELIIDELAGHAALTVGMSKETIAEVLDNAAKKEGTALTSQQIVEALAHAKAKDVETEAIWKKISAQIVEHGHILLIAAAIAALIAVIYLLVKAYNADADAAKRAAEAAEELRKNSEEVAQKAQDIKQTFEGYNSAIKTLKECTKGTEAWKDALKEVNNQVLEILTKYPELAGKIQTYRDAETGALMIGNIDNITNQADREAVAVRNAAIWGNIYAKQTQLKSDITDTRREYYGPSAFSGLVNKEADHRISVIENFTKYIGTTEHELKQLVGNLGLSDEQFSKFYQDLNRLADSFNDLNNTIEASSALMIENYLGDTASIETKTIAANTLKKTATEIINDILRTGTGTTSGFGGIGKQSEEKDIFQRYMAALGEQGTLNYFTKGFLGFGDQVNVNYTNAKGETREVGLEIVANTIASFEAIKQASQNAADAANKIKNLGENATTFGGYITNGNFESSSKQDLIGFSGLTNERLLEQLGYKTAEEFEKAFGISLETLRSNLSDTIKAFEHFGDDLSPVATSAFGVIKEKFGEAFDALPLDKQKEYINLANQLANTLGRDGVTALATFDKTTIDLIKEYDFANGSVYDFNSVLEDAGLATLDTNEALRELVEKLLEAASATYTLADAQKAYADVHKITDKLKNGGDITQEEYNTLTTNVPGLADYFMNNVSGNYTFTGDRTKLDDYIDAALLQNFDKSASSYTSNRDLLSGILSGDTGLLLQSSGTDLTKRQSIVQERINFLSALGEDTSAYSEAFNNESIWMNSDLLREIAEKTQEYANNEELLTSKIADYNEKIKESNGIQGTAVQNTVDLSNKIKNSTLSTEAQEKALVTLGTQYDVTIPLVQKYKQAIKDSGSESIAAKQAASELWKELRKQEWSTLLSGLEKSLKVLATEDSSRDNIIKANQEIANSFNEMFETAIDASWVDEHKQLFIDLANADAEQVNDLAENILNLINLEENWSTKLEGLGLKYSEVADFIRSNPIEIDVNGQANLGALMESLYQAGYTSEQVAHILRAIGQTRVSIFGSNGEIFDYDLSDVDQLEDFLNQLQTFHLDFNGIGEVPKVSNVFGTSARDYTQKINTDKSTGSGGGKGSGTPKKENKETKEDRYHVEEDRLDNLSKAYDRLEKAKSHAYGPDKLKYIQQEIDLLDDEIAAQEALVTETEKYLEQDVSQLNYGKKNAFYLDGVVYDQRGLDFYGLTAQIDQFGAIANYNEIMAAGLEKYNAAVDEYNTAGSAHYQDDNFLKYEKEQWQGLQDLVSQTEKTIDKNYEEITEYQEKIRQQNTLRMEKITSHLEFHIELNARDLKEVEYQLSKLGDDVYKTGEVAALLWSQSSDSKASLAVENIERYQSAYNELNTLLAAGQVNQDEYYEEIQKISDGLYEELGNIQDLNETAKTYYSDTLQKMGEKISWFTDRLAHNNTVLEHMKNIYMSLTQEDDFASIGKFIDASLNHAEKELEVAKATTDAYKEQKEARQLDFDEAKRLYEEALASGDENAIEAARNGLTIAENELKAITEAFEEAEEKELEKFNQVISLMIEKVKNTIQQGYQDIEKTYTNGLGWDAINQQMSLAEKLGDKYLTKTNQAYEMSKLISQVNKDIDKTNNSNSKIRLRNFTIELENLKNTNQLSKNSLAIEQAKYEVLKAELALEEARDAKSTVRLQRDNEGNFGYVYTADRDNISDAEANLAQKQNDLYNLSLQQANDNAKELIQITQEKYNALRELDLKYVTDQTNPIYLEQRVALEKYFDDLILANTKDHLIASQVLQDSSITQENDSWSKEWEDLTKKHYGYITASDSFWTTNFANVTGKTQDFFNTNNPLWDAFYSGIMSNAQTTQEKVTSEMELMKTKNLPVLQLLADTIGDASLEGSLVNRYGSLETALGKIEAADKLVLATLLDGEGDEKGLITALKEQATAAHDATAEWQQWYTALLQEGGAVEAAQAINTEIQTMLEELAQIEDKEYTITKHEKTVYDAPVGSPTGTVYTTPPPSTTGTGTGGNVTTGSRENQFNNQSQTSSRESHLLYTVQQKYNDYSPWTTYIASAWYTETEIKDFLKRLRSGAIGTTITYRALRDDTGQNSGFATGGYTGSWGPEGKLATLHEKELVLNKDDTANFLAGINILRQITDAIDLQALSMSAAAGVALPSLGNQAQALEQTVTITAEFPNVSNHLEIEEAFNNLVNRASQYANRF